MFADDFMFGKVMEDKNIRAFLEYVKTQNATDDWTTRLEKRVAEIRTKQSARKDYMTYQMHIKEWLREGRAEAIAIGEDRGIAEGISRGAHDARVETAYALLALGVAIHEQINQATRLPLAEIALQGTRIACNSVPCNRLSEPHGELH